MAFQPKSPETLLFFWIKPVQYFSNITNSVYFCDICITYENTPHSSDLRNVNFDGAVLGNSISVLFRTDESADDIQRVSCYIMFRFPIEYLTYSNDPTASSLHWLMHYCIEMIYQDASRDCALHGKYFGDKWNSIYNYKPKNWHNT